MSDQALVAAMRELTNELRTFNRQRFQKSLDMRDAAAYLGVSDATFAKIRQALIREDKDPVQTYPGVPQGRIPIETLDAIRLGTEN